MKKRTKVLLSSMLAILLVFGVTLNFSEAASTSTAKTIENLKKQVKNLTSSNKKKDTEIKKLKTQVAEKDKNNKSLNSSIISKDKEISSLKSKVSSLESQLNSPTTPTIPNSDLSQTINDVTVQIDKVVQDSDSLKIYVTYINNSKEEKSTEDSLAKIVANGKQFEYDHDFNFPRYYEKDVPKAASFIEPGVTEKSVIFFKPVETETINIVLNANFDDYRFNNVPLQK